MSARTDEEASRNQASSGVTPDTLRQALTTRLGATEVHIEDMSGKQYLSVWSLDEIMRRGADANANQAAAVRCSKR